MLSMVLHLLVNSSKDETGVQWKWWDQHNRKESWYRALIHAIVSIRQPVFMGTFIYSDHTERKYHHVEDRHICSVGLLH